MVEARRGGCQCGHIRYELTEAPLGVSVCHCRACQKQSGSAFGMSLHLPATAFRLASGSLKTFEVVCDSGRIKTCAFCPECGTRIFHRTERGLSVKAGTLDDPSGIVPDGHYWTRSKQAWVRIPEGVRQFPDDG
ncbi:MAG TPA: GFA family protein [Stellaceae bacterium]|nr:GFA family protein [Stellaceae bacterium]